MFDCGGLSITRIRMQRAFRYIGLTRQPWSAYFRRGLWIISDIIVLVAAMAMVSAWLGLVGFRLVGC
jgi:hypothetical protein